MKLMIILQNAYMDREGSVLSGEPLFIMSAYSWKYTSFDNVTERRLKKIVPNACDIIFGNASPKIGNNPNSFFSYDENHVGRMILKYKPDLVLLCGKEAGKAENLIRKIGLPYVLSLHPAARILSNEYCKSKRKEIIREIIRIML